LTLRGLRRKRLSAKTIKYFKLGFRFLINIFINLDSYYISVRVIFPKEKVITLKKGMTLQWVL
jgi:hypothetical protein